MLEGIAENNRKVKLMSTSGSPYIWSRLVNILTTVIKFLQAKEEMAKFNNKMEGAVKTKLGSTKVAKKKKKLKRKKKKEVDPKAPRRPMSAYFEFASKERQKVKVMLESGGCHEVSKELGRRWNSFSEEERAPFVARANEKMKRFKQVSLGFKSSMEM